MDDSKPLGPWSEASQKGQAASQGVDGVDESKTLGPWSEPSQKGRSAQQKRTATSDQSRPPKKARCVDLTQACVMDIPHHVRGHAVPVSKKTERAKDPKAIKERYSGNGRCVCAKHKAQKAPPCHRRVPLALILQLCCALAGMSTEEKGFIFYQMYNASGEDEESQRSTESRCSRKSWCIGEHKMCFTNFCWMLFCSPATVREFVTIEAGSDGKRISKRHKGSLKPQRPRQQGIQVDFFFQEYYQSAGEPLPQVTQRRANGVHVDADVVQEVNGQWGPWLNKGDPLNGQEDDQYEPDRPIIDVAHMCTLACDGAVVGLPVRFLQHSTLYALYWQFLAHWEALQSSSRLEVKESGCQGSAPSFATFSRRWTSVWRFYLKFRKSSAHAQCNTCFKLQRVMFERGSTVTERLDAARHLREHIRVTYLDRQIYWNLRFASRGYSDVLVIIIDSMDKTKFAWPRFSFSRRPHDLGDLIRPRITFTIAMAHGYCIDMYAAPEELNHGSDAFLEVLCRTIDHVRRICHQRHIPFPRHLVIQSDNTVAQAKNQYVSFFLAVLVSRRLFLSVNLMFLVVGHTHEDIDQLFGVIVCLILQLGSFQTILELMQYLLEKLRAKFAAKQEVVTQTCLSAVRDFAKWCQPLQRSVWNCWGNRLGQESPHSFTYKQGRELTRSEQAWFDESRGLDVSEDVYCCVKTYMRDTTLQQAPVLILPADRHERLVGEPREVCGRHAMGKPKIDNYTKLKAKLKDYGLMEAAKALHALMYDRSYSLPAFPWLSRGWVVDRADRGDSGNYFFPHLPASSWRLFAGEAKQKRRR